MKNEDVACFKDINPAKAIFLIVWDYRDNSKS